MPQRDPPSDDLTLPDTSSSAATTPTGTVTGTEPTGRLELPAASGRGYELVEMIGRGGMGEVLLARDTSIGRDVAIKRLRTDDPDANAEARFLREARIQARLDHPAIVPVYEIGHDAKGLPYFTMKRLAGGTLADRLAGPAQVQPLLRAFAEICLAVEFAHARKVIHRDLKPANIILGDYGEVYVLDWGLARSLDDEHVRAASLDSGEPGATEAGAMMGTPGYMPPEQMREARDAGPPADVYALGAILFEIIAGESLHPRGAAAIASTLAPIDGSPARRSPDRSVPPELDAWCIRALATDPRARPTARQLGEAVQHYVDGDRDLEQRRAIAAQQLAVASAALEGDRRADAMRAAGRALALDPESTAAAELVTALLLEPPAAPPPELAAELRASDATAVRHHARASTRAFLWVLTLLPLAIWNGVQSWRVVGGVLVIVAVLAFVAWQMSRSPERTLREMVLYVVCTGVLIALLSRVCGPFLFVPAVASFIAISVATFPIFAGRSWIVVVVTLAAWLAPIAFESLGMLRLTWYVTDGLFASTSAVIDIGGVSTMAFVLAANAVTIGIGGVQGGRISQALLEAQHKLVGQAWHLRQLLPQR